VFLSTDNGTSWTNVSTGMTNPYVTALAVNGTDLFAGTESMWRRPLSEMITSVDIEPTQPTEFILEQNYPNPFNPSTVISYQLPVSSDIVLKVFDVLGNEIATLIDEYKPAGKYEVEFSSSTLPSGVYFYQMRASEYVQTRKMILIK
jgi:hypothetical protein